MAAPIIIGAALGVGGTLMGAYANARALEAQGYAQRQAFEMNAKFAEFNAKQALERGDEAAKAYKDHVNKTIGTQRASYAAQGVDVNSGSAMEVQKQTAELGAQDVLTIKNNAWREAWGMRVEAGNSRIQAQYAESTANATARATLLTGGLQAGAQGASGYSKYKYGVG